MARVKKSALPRGLWKGAIAFGLVHIPVYLVSASQEKPIRFNLLDKKDFAHIGYKQYNKKTGKEVPRQRIVKGYEIAEGRYIILEDKDFEKANPKATRSIDIEDFVAIEEIDPMLFEEPYYIMPQNGGEKSYSLLRDVLHHTKKVAIAKIVLHRKQHLVAIMARESYLILEILRFANEVKEASEAPKLVTESKRGKISSREIKVAEDLVAGMTSHWKPHKYKDSYREDLMKLIKAKAKRGSAKKVEEAAPSPPEEDAPNNLVDLTQLLQKSLNAAKKPRGKKGKSA